jgi:hypothetical protein
MSANRKHVITPSSTSGKAEEIAFITNLAEDIQAGTYLAQLFTKNFVSWVVEQIRNDFTPDLMGALEQAHIDHSHVVCQAEREAKQLVDSKALETKDLLTKLDGARSANSDLLKNNDSLRERIEFLEDMEGNLTTARIETARDLKQATSDLAIAEQKVIELKARLFDLIDRK